MQPAKSIVVLGGGVTGLTVAAELAGDGRHHVLLLENAPDLGGLASTFQIEGHTFDTGSHRLHEDCVPAVAQLLHELCGDDLLRRERNGVIYIRGKPLPYPPTVFDILHSLTTRERASALRDLIHARLHAARFPPAKNFEQYAIGRVGRFLYERFYQPYAAKLYGMPPTALGIEPALTRVRRFRTSAVVRDLARHLSRRRAFYRYPRHGIGQIATALGKRLRASGGEVVHIQKVELGNVEGTRCISNVVFRTREGAERTVPTDLVVSTIPIHTLFHLFYPDDPPPEIRWRNLRISYLLCSGKHQGPHETYYCPDPDIIFGRVSDLSKYSPSLNSYADRFVLAAEMPCSPGDPVCGMSDGDLGARCLAELKRLGAIPPGSELINTFSRMLPCVYPVYDHGWKQAFERAFQRLDRTENLYMVGRTALFMHCNIDHCLWMALELAKHLLHSPGDKQAWNQQLAHFTAYRVRE
jgi:protoporphyrinogen oxidase